MPSHQARRKPLPKDYQFPTGEASEVLYGVAPVRLTSEELSRLVTRERRRLALDVSDDGDGYGHAV